ncbi:MAG: GYF domain-containing protein [Pseudomonadota bacterium]
MAAWYYVENNQRMGPAEEDRLAQLIRDGVLDRESFVWKKGMKDWQKLEMVEELKNFLVSDSFVASETAEFAPLESAEGDVSFDEETVLLDANDNPIQELRRPAAAAAVSPAPVSTFSLPSSVSNLRSIKSTGPDWNKIGEDKRVFLIKTGLDRSGPEVEYGPFSLTMLKKLFDEERINAKTMIFTTGMENWMLLGEIPLYTQITSQSAPVIEEVNRRANIRKPFVAKMFLHDNAQVFEGLCRDISVGGLQILISDFPAKVGDKISLNVHPDNTDFCFVASGKVARVLNGNQGLSLRFEKLTEDALRAINAYLDQTANN